MTEQNCERYTDMSTVKLDFKELLNKEQIDFKELFTDYQVLPMQIGLVNHLR